MGRRQSPERQPAVLLLMVNSEPETATTDLGLESQAGTKGKGKRVH